MSNKTFWALKQREWDRREAAPNRLTRRVRAMRSMPPAPVVVEPVAAEVVVEEVVEPAEEPSYRDLQTQAKELEIPANQSAEDLKAAIEEASEG